MDLFNEYIEKWSEIGLQAEFIQHDDAANNIKRAYHYLNLSEPSISFSSQPTPVLSIFLQSKLVENKDYYGIGVESQLSRSQEVKLKHQLGLELARTFTDKLLLQLSTSIGDEIGNDIGAQLWVKLENALRRKINPSYSKPLRNCINCREWICYACKFDFCITELGVPHDPELWTIFQALVKSCDWFVPFIRACLIGDCSVTKYL